MNTRFRIVSLAAAVLVAVAVGIVIALPASAARWNAETLDGNSTASGRVNGDVGFYNASVVYGNQPHVFYLDGTNFDLRHAWWTGAAWAFETLDGNSTTGGRVDGKAGSHVAVTIWNNQPHVWYRDFFNLNLRHAWWTGSGWAFETLDGDCATEPCSNGAISADLGYETTAAVWNNQPHVWYRDVTGGNLRHGWWSGSGWRFETLDGNGTADGRVDSNVGWYNVATVWNNQPHVWYQDLGNGDLRHAWWTGSNWHFETLDGNCPVTCTAGRINGIVGSDNAVAVWNNTPHVWYRDGGNGDLRHAWWTGAAWQFEPLDGNCSVLCVNGRIDGDVGVMNTAAILNSKPHVFYGDQTNGDQRHAWWTGTTWQFETIDGNCATEPCADGRVGGVVGGYNTVVVWNNQPHVWASHKTNYDLRHSWYG